MATIFRLFVHPMGGAHVLIENDRTRQPLANMMLEDFKRQYDQLQEDVKLANENVAFLNDNNEMEDGNGRTYVAASKRHPRRRKT